MSALFLIFNIPFCRTAFLLFVQIVQLKLAPIDFTDSLVLFYLTLIRLLIVHFIHSFSLEERT